MRLNETENREEKVLSTLKTPQKKLMNWSEGGGECRWIICYCKMLHASAALLLLHA